MTFYIFKGIWIYMFIQGEHFYMEKRHQSVNQFHLISALMDAFAKVLPQQK